MRTFYSPRQSDHCPAREIHRGEVLTPFESPQRADRILSAVRNAEFGEIVEPQLLDFESLPAIHDSSYLSFLSGLWDRWTAETGGEDVLPHVWPARNFDSRPPDSIFGLLGYYSFDAGTPICEGTWPAALASASTAVSAADDLAAGRRMSFALCRPPGHHAAADQFGGYCFLNNAALAVQRLRDQGASRVAVLDVDYHHGNGTQSIFYDRGDVLFISIHADPKVAYPYFAGYAHESGTGEGEGATLNLPLPDGVEWESYQRVLTTAIDAIHAFQPNQLVISLGVDTYERDPISTFRLTRDDLRRMGGQLATLHLPTTVVMEGGYAVDELGDNVVSFLTGLLELEK